MAEMEMKEIGSLGLDREFEERLSLSSSRASTSFSNQIGRMSVGGIRSRGHFTNFLQDWAIWRTHLNRSLIVKSELTERLHSRAIVKKFSNHSRQFRPKMIRAPKVEIEKVLSDFILERALQDRQTGGRKYQFMSPESCITFGIPRPKSYTRKHTPVMNHGFSLGSGPGSSVPLDEPPPDYDRLTRF